MKNLKSVFSPASLLATLAFVLCCVTSNFAADRGSTPGMIFGPGFDQGIAVHVATYQLEVNSAATIADADRAFLNSSSGAEAVVQNVHVVTNVIDGSMLFSKDVATHDWENACAITQRTAGFMQTDQHQAAVFAALFRMMSVSNTMSKGAFLMTCVNSSDQAVASSGGFQVMLLNCNSSTPGDVQVISNFTSTAGSFLPGMIMNINNMGAAESNFFLQASTEVSQAS